MRIGQQLKPENILGRVRAVNFEKLIRDLYAQKEKLVQAIALLEDLAVYRQGTPHYAERSERRGRKSMGVDERREVSQRMKKYWAARRKREA
jgi:hypothetical protein